MTFKEFVNPSDFESKLKLLFDEDLYDERLNELFSWYGNLYNSYLALLNKANKSGSGFVLITQPDFTLSYIENKPLFDGSDESTEVFTVDTYQNYTLFETRQVPTSFLKDPDIVESNDDVVYDSGFVLKTTPDGDLKISR